MLPPQLEILAMICAAKCRAYAAKCDSIDGALTDLSPFQVAMSSKWRALATQIDRDTESNAASAPKPLSYIVE